ncbi:bZIP transcription factor 17 [Mercurialis annua]|uniref:bZIP transcription factor 17 n=1 Tax=Mercurialis annua TaxID=3986 RepID=UPI00215F7418|nr:bZIP transcription factor 17 [Mercurialis annua]
MGDADQQPPLNDYDSLAVPPLDHIFLSAQSSDENYVSDLHFSLDDSNCDFDITFDDFDDFFFQSENDPNSTDQRHSESPVSASYGASAGDDDVAAKYLNSSPSSEYVNSNSCDHSDAELNALSPASSQGSGNADAYVGVDQKIKLEKQGLWKRKKETEDTSGETRTPKYRRSENANPNNESFATAATATTATDEDEKKRARLMRNRESAQLSRQRKKHYVEELEDKVKSMHSTIADLNTKISYFMAENATLRQQVSTNGICPPPIYPPMPPMAFPWLACAPYVVKPQGSQVPLVPIPRLKTHQPRPAVKSKKSEDKKAGGSKTKKVASVSFLGLLFFIFLFGCLVPIVNVKFGGVRDNSANGFGSDKLYHHHTERVLRVDGHLNGSHENLDFGFSSGNHDKGYRIHCGRGTDGCLAYDSDKKRGFEHLPDTDEFTRRGNNSKSLAASLYVPRNDKLVKIDGNLIIHSVLASERAMSSHENLEVKKSKETGLAIPRDMSPSPAIPGRYSYLYRHLNERQKALTSESSDTSKDHVKSSAADGKLQKWFHEGLAGPMLSSGMCSEVFHFDVSPTPGAIIPASSVANITTERQQNVTNLKGKNRRILHRLPVSLTGSNHREHVQNSQKDNFQGNKTVSPMIVSVLVDPREGSDIEVDGIIKPKSISRIFVVVLLDSVKYVTYSCMLPLSGPHLVTT